MDLPSSKYLPYIRNVELSFQRILTGMFMFVRVIYTLLPYDLKNVLTSNARIEIYQIVYNKVKTVKRGD
jgi:hypothetical protein